MNTLYYIAHAALYLALHYFWIIYMSKIASVSLSLVLLKVSLPTRLGRLTSNKVNMSLFLNRFFYQIIDIHMFTQNT